MLIFIDMENILPFIIGAIVLAAKAYNNFQKEQEKARKRNPQQRPVGEVSADFESEPGNARRQVLDDSSLPERHRQAKESTEPTLIPSAYEAYSGAMHEVEEVRRTREIRKKHHAQGVKRLETYRAEVTGASTDGFMAAEDFDLRDAVIKSAILNRPYID